MSDLVTLSVYECSEFHSMGEVHEGIKSVDEAIRVWNSIPPSRMNGIKSIAIVVGEGWEATEFEAVVGKTMDLEMLRYYSDITTNQEALSLVKELREKIPDIEVVGEIPAQQEASAVRPRHRR
ncbi:hypothetical protein [Clostridioides difficile]|uniref:hypothetical protein n=1 Tax=Clostridioides difficile TaxID=1496 RepID=UPI001FF26095|nr:hypothetical protein [Clostridioides difficile]